MGFVYAVINQKGGVGKTTTAVNVAACLALQGKRTLLIDMDPQGNATSGVGVDKNAAGRIGSGFLSTYDVLINGSPIDEAICRTSVPNLYLLASNPNLAGAELELTTQADRERILQNRLGSLHTKYDYIFVDAPPSLGLLTLNSLVAAHYAIIPIQCEYYALEGVSQLMKTVDLVQRHLNPALEIGLIIMTMYDNRIRLAQQVVSEVREVFGNSVSSTLVPRNVRLSEAPSHGLPVMIYDPKSRGAQAYRAIAQEVSRIGKKRAR